MKNAATRPPKKGEHQNVARAALVIEALSKAREKGLRLTDVAQQTQLGAATVHRLLAGLAAHGFLDHDPHSNRYFVGLRILGWAVAATERYGLAPYVETCLEGLCTATEDTIYFSLVSGIDAVCIDRREGSYPIKTLTLGAGDRRPLGIGAGSMALLAFQTDAFIAKVLREDESRRLKFGITTEFLRAELAKVRDRGYALNDGRLIPGMSGVGVPIRKQDGQAVAALSVAALTARLSGDRLEFVVQLLKREAQGVEQAAAEVLNSSFARRNSIRPAR